MYSQAGVGEMVEAAIKGYNATIFAYGQTGLFEIISNETQPASYILYNAIINIVYLSISLSTTNQLLQHKFGTGLLSQSNVFGTSDD